MERYGAHEEAWDEWSALGVGRDLLPVVSNPNAQISPMSKMKAMGKTPSWYNSSGHVAGIAGWTDMVATPEQIAKWKQQKDYGIAAQTRQLGAFDGDIPDPAKAKPIRDAIINFWGPCPIRFREGTGKFLIPFKRSFPMTKRVIPVDGGMLEVLGDGQQFIAEGTHPSGTRYQWDNPISLMRHPDEAKFEELFQLLVLCFATGEPRIAREKRKGTGTDLAVTDGVAEWLVDNWETHDVGDQGQVFIRCPFSGEHTSESGETSTAYFPAGTGGYQQGHFVCLHAHCVGRPDAEFLDGTGYSLAQFSDLIKLPTLSGSDGGLGGAQTQPLPDLALVRDKQGRIEPTADNLVKLLSRPDQIDKQLAFDEFKDVMVWAPAHQPVGHQQWREFTDPDYVDIRIELERRGMKPMGHELLRSSIFRAAVEFRMDTATEWLSRLQWDGVPRIEHFCSLGWGWAVSDYSRAVGRYVWTALAGRVIEPGCQADMAPILVGPQGVGKTSAIKAMAPSDDCYVTIPLSDHDTDTSRRLRGKLVIELEELRGLNSRAIEEIKAWITRTTEGWIPKYKEFENTFKRRAICFGTTNDDEFLNDPTGERRWLPGRCGPLDIEWIRANREQLWAEGAAMFLIGGVDWEDAQRLGLGEHHEYKVTDSWEHAVERWMIEPQIGGDTPVEAGYITVTDVLSGAVNIPVAQQDRGKEMRMAKILRGLGWTRKRVPVGDRRIWAYVKED